MGVLDIQSLSRYAYASHPSWTLTCNIPSLKLHLFTDLRHHAYLYIGVLPPEFGVTPTIYFKVQISTGRALTDSFCDHDIEVFLRVHNLTDVSSLDHVAPLVRASKA